MAYILVLFITIVFPLLCFVYAIIKREKLPFILGVLAFTISQICLRLPLLNLLSKKVTSFTMFQATSPILFIALLALSAGIFEETARWIAMKFFMKSRNAVASIHFGLGHGGIEALLLIGIPYIVQYSLIAATEPGYIYLAGLERVLAILLHVSLSVIVFYSVRERKPLYYVLAIILHGLVNFAIAVLASYFNLVLAEIVFVVLTSLLVILSLLILKRMIRDEKQI